MICWIHFGQSHPNSQAYMPVSNSNPQVVSLEIEHSSALNHQARNGDIGNVILYIC